MNLAYTQRRARLVEELTALKDLWADYPEDVAVIDEWLANKDDAKGSEAAAAKLVAALTKHQDCTTCGPTVKKVLSEKDCLVKKSVWIFGGDGWAYDIGYGGLDHVLASGEDVNVLVLDTEVYSNTGGRCC